MIAVLLAATVLCTVVAFVVLLDRRDARAREERRELMNRVQHPEYTVPLEYGQEPIELPEVDLDSLARAGTVVPGESESEDG